MFQIMYGTTQANAKHFHQYCAFGEALFVCQVSPREVEDFLGLHRSFRRFSGFFKVFKGIKYGY